MEAELSTDIPGNTLTASTLPKKQRAATHKALPRLSQSQGPESLGVGD